MQLTLHFDGACEPRNPGGIATYGWILSTGESGSGVADRGPTATNNVAEYCALGFGLLFLSENDWQVTELEIRGDSKLVIEQINHNWQCKAPRMVKLRDRCLHILDSLECNWTARWIPRAENEAADALSRKAYAEAVGRHQNG